MPSRPPGRHARRQGALRTALALTAAAALTLTSMNAAQAAPDEGNAAALPGDFQAPFECDLETTYKTFEGHRPPLALDFVRADGGEDTGTPILASAAGTARLVDQPRPGQVVNIEHEGGWETRHYHLDTRTVEDGEEVDQGQQIGTMGKTGSTPTAPHLHYEQHLNGELQEIALQGESLAPYPDGYDQEFITSTNGCDDEDPPPEQEGTELSYTGPDTVSNAEAAELSGSLTDEAGEPVADREVSFALGEGGAEQTCSGDTDGDGTATCMIDEVDQEPGAEGTAPLTLAFEGDDEYESSEASVDLQMTLETELAYNGPENVANDAPAELSGTLIDETGEPVVGGEIAFALGGGEAEQTCSGAADAEGTATCTIDEVDQPLSDEGTLPVSLAYEGDDLYEPSEAASEVLLEHMTGSAFGLSAEVPVLGLPISLDPEPDTGEVRTAHAETVEPDCTQNIGAVVVTAELICAQVESGTAPTSVTSTAELAETQVGLPGLPVIEVSGLEVSSTSTCEEQTGSVDMSLTVAGVPVEVGQVPDLEVDLGVVGTELVVNEQIEEEDGSLTVNGARLTAPGGVDVVLGSATSAAHNCA